MEKMLFKGFGYCYGNKMLLLTTNNERRTKAIYNKFIDFLCDLKGITDKQSQYTEYNYKALKFGVTPIQYFDCGSYVSIRFENGQANYPKNDMEEIILIN